MKKRTLKISSIVGSGYCVSSEDGHKVHEKIFEYISSGDKVELSFENVTRITTAFLNAAVGQLYGEFDYDVVRSSLLPPVDYEPWHLQRLSMVVLRAKQYFNNADEMDSIYNNMLD